MSRPPGLYKLAFHSSYGTDYGVAVLGDDGRVRGGDSGMAYLGSYRQDGDVLSMTLPSPSTGTCWAWCPCLAKTT